MPPTLNWTLEVTSNYNLEVVWLNHYIGWPATYCRCTYFGTSRWSNGAMCPRYQVKCPENLVQHDINDGHSSKTTRTTFHQTTDFLQFGFDELSEKAGDKHVDVDWKLYYGTHLVKIPIPYKSPCYHCRKSVCELFEWLGEAHLHYFRFRRSNDFSIFDFDRISGMFKPKSHMRR